MARGKKIKGKTADEKIKAVHKMVEALISGDSDAAADHLHAYLQAKTRELILGEKEDEKEKPDFADIDEDGDKKESAKKADKDKKEEMKDEDCDDDDDKKSVKESVSPRANLTGAKGPKFAKENANKGKISGNSLRDKPKKANDTKAKAGLPKHSNHGDTSIKGNSFKNKPHKANLTGARGPKFADENVNKGNVAHYDDGRDYDMGTGNV